MPAHDWRETVPGYDGSTPPTQVYYPDFVAARTSHCKCYLCGAVSYKWSITKIADTGGEYVTKQYDFYDEMRDGDKLDGNGDMPPLSGTDCP